MSTNQSIMLPELRLWYAWLLDGGQFSGLLNITTSSLALWSIWCYMHSLSSDIRSEKFLGEYSRLICDLGLFMGTPSCLLRRYGPPREPQRFPDRWSDHGYAYSSYRSRILLLSDLDIEQLVVVALCGIPIAIVHTGAALRCIPILMLELE
ncbi:hypothetical protein BJV74DRAFT_498121 [Russula compacta]|nr:hypothetical protein BJV74DRAFT_498121 [Russula compacta]